MGSTMTGEQLAALAYAQPPLTPKGFALALEIVVLILGIISTGVFILRVWARSFLKSGQSWGADDYLAVLGFSPFIPSCVFAVLAVHYGLAAPDSELNPFLQLRAAEYIIYWEFTCIIASMVTKCSIGFVCIRLNNRKRYTIPIYLNMFLMVTPIVGGLSFVLGNCKPFAATWNPSLGKCSSTKGIIIVSYLVSAVQMATDWVCATIPFFIIRELQLPRRTKISVIAILGVGIFASIASVVRMPYFKYYDTDAYPNDYMYHVGNIVLWSQIECSLCLIAASLPPLRRLFKFFRESQESGTFELKKSSGLDSVSNPKRLYRSATRGVDGGEWDRLDDDSVSGKQLIIQKVHDRYQAA